MRKTLSRLTVGATTLAMVLTAMPVNVLAEGTGEWRTEDGVEYWYEDGVKQGTEDRGKEIYDSGIDAWYWLDAVDGGKKAVSKDVYMDSDAGVYADNTDGTGKWVRYDADGHMIKGWCAGKDESATAISSPDDANGADVYYFDPTYGTMAKGKVTIDGVTYTFNEETGICEGEAANSDTDTTEPVTNMSLRTLKSTCYETEGSGRKSHYEYDENGYQTKVSDYNTAGELRFYYTYEHDANGNMTKYSGYNVDGTLLWYDVCEYDDNGDLLKKTTYGSDAQSVYSMTYSSEYSEVNGSSLITVETSTYTSSETGSTSISRTEYVYDESGEMVRVNYYSDGELESYHTLEGDIDWTVGAISKRIVKYYDSNGSLQYYYVYEYEVYEDTL